MSKTTIVQAGYALGGAIVCGRKENGKLTLYRLPTYQDTGQLLEVFNPKEKLEWDMQKSNTSTYTRISRNKTPD